MVKHSVLAVAFSFIEVIYAFDLIVLKRNDDFFGEVNQTIFLFALGKQWRCKAPGVKEYQRIVIKRNNNLVPFGNNSVFGFFSYNKVIFETVGDGVILYFEQV